MGYDSGSDTANTPALKRAAAGCANVGLAAVMAPRYPAGVIHTTGKLLHVGDPPQMPSRQM